MSVMSKEPKSRLTRWSPSIRLRKVPQGATVEEHEWPTTRKGRIVFRIVTSLAALALVVLGVVFVNQKADAMCPVDDPCTYTDNDLDTIQTRDGNLVQRANNQAHTMGLGGLPDAVVNRIQDKWNATHKSKGGTDWIDKMKDMITHKVGCATSVAFNTACAVPPDEWQQTNPSYAELKDQLLKATQLPSHIIFGAKAIAEHPEMRKIITCLGTGSLQGISAFRYQVLIVNGAKVIADVGTKLNPLTFGVVTAGCMFTLHVAEEMGTGKK